jgi:sulfur transfer protein SufE
MLVIFDGNRTPNEHATATSEIFFSSSTSQSLSLSLLRLHGLKNLIYALKSITLWSPHWRTR